jgi:small subunit ribosomal protein S21
MKIITFNEGGCLFLTGVYVSENENIESALKKFKKACEREGILSELKKREFYEKPSIKRKKKAIAARKRLMKKLKKLASRGDI